MVTKIHVAEIILLAIILFDGVVTISGMNQHGYWYYPSVAFEEEGNPIAQQLFVLGAPLAILIGFAYIFVVWWFYHIENPIRFALFGSVLILHLFGGLTWVIPPWGIFIWGVFQNNIWIMLLGEIGIGIVLGFVLSLSKKWRKFLDASIKLPI